MRKIMIVGATSAIAQETAQLFAAAGDRLFLVGRHPERLAAVSEDLKVRSKNEVFFRVQDLNDVDDHELLLKEAQEALGGLDTVLIAHGVLGDQQAEQEDYRKTELSFRTNLLSAISLLTQIANLFEAQGHGTIAVITSVAGDRGRQSNYVYGTAKSALSTFLSGLRNRLHPKNVQVLDIRPGFVDTPMTAHIEKGPLFVSPAVIAKGIVRAIEKRRDVVYLPWFWWGIMLIIRSIPEKIFKRLKL